MLHSEKNYFQDGGSVDINTVIISDDVDVDIIMRNIMHAHQMRLKLYPSPITLTAFEIDEHNLLLKEKAKKMRENKVLSFKKNVKG